MTTFFASLSRAGASRRMASVLCAALVLAPQSPWTTPAARAQCCGEAAVTAVAPVATQTYRLDFQTVYDERPMTAYRVSYETVYDTQSYTVQRPVWETQTSERRYTVQVRASSVRSNNTIGALDVELNQDKCCVLTELSRERCNRLGCIARSGNRGIITGIACR